MNRPIHVVVLAAALHLAVGVCVARAQSFGSQFPGLSTFTPKVPVSALARPMSWFDPSRLHVSTSVSVGSGFGSGTNALQLTNLSYQFGAPLWMNVSVGNAWGPDRARSNSSFFLEGLDVGYRPLPNLRVQIQYRNIRSPLQYGAPGAGIWGE